LNVKQAGEIMENDASRSSDRLKLESWPVERLIPSVHNARSHSPTQVAEIAGSIRAFGFSNPILVSPEGDIIAGHGGWQPPVSWLSPRCRSSC
jgi:hypothetical protein